MLYSEVFSIVMCDIDPEETKRGQGYRYLKIELVR